MDEYIETWICLGAEQAKLFRSHVHRKWTKDSLTILKQEPLKGTIAPATRLTLRVRGASHLWRVAEEWHDYLAYLKRKEQEAAYERRPAVQALKEATQRYEQQPTPYLRGRICALRWVLGMETKGWEE